MIRRCNVVQCGAHGLFICYARAQLKIRNAKQHNYHSIHAQSVRTDINRIMPTCTCVHVTGLFHFFRGIFIFFCILFFALSMANLFMPILYCNFFFLFFFLFKNIVPSILLHTHFDFVCHFMFFCFKLFLFGISFSFLLL